jgi:hypothetical protein
MKLSQVASKMAADILEAGGFVKCLGTRVYIEVGSVRENLLVWWLNRRYPIQPPGTDTYTLFLRELQNADKGRNFDAVSCALDCGCGGTERSNLFKSMLLRKLGR